ncbi:tetratricopeptide repeat protein [Lacinutrix sp. C3R15]|uniref:tetratricopeptide repeat protein n=1 Tax=Flavobacteriaceae TaxID=49546 RepID=UPI001C088D77|nr:MULTISPECIES: tetratricopeptide repeat protein [Flavobacteriaceae]MBU2939426.1 tetratricopeptide repeat protein [Lacinutrix sp. C3R15]MDO6622741.1 tetratricopeptide repeat protein [Oceanihabitans sp. 1_MG-2023]
MKNQDLLYHYFSNSLTAEQEEVFKKLLENDAEFKAQFLFEQNLKEVIKSNEIDILKAKLKGFEKDLAATKTTRIENFNTKKTKSKTFVFNYKTFAVAASIAILMGWFGYNSFFKTNYSSIYNDNFSVYPNTVYTITRGDTKNTLEREAFVAFESKEYKTTIEKLNAIPADANKAYFNFYKAQAYLNLEDTEKAEQLFTQVVKDSTGFVAESIWYLALIAIKEENKNQAIQHLENLIENYSYNKDAATALLEKLN